MSLIEETDKEYPTSCRRELKTVPNTPRTRTDASTRLESCSLPENVGLV